MGKWPMKTDRELLKLALADRDAEQIAEKLDKPLPSVLKAAKRLGIGLAQSRRPDRRLKRK